MKPRCIRENKDFADALDRIRQDYSRASDWWIAWSYRLARDPLTDAMLVPNSIPAAYLIKPDRFDVDGAPPAMTILYRFDDENLDMINIRLP